MKKKFCWISLLPMLINIIAFWLFMMILGGGLYRSVIWYIWMILCILTPFAPLYAKYYRVKNGQSGKIFEIIAIIMSLFNFANVCIYGFRILWGDYLGWAALIICALVYSKVIKEAPKVDGNGEVRVEKQVDITE